MSCFIRRYFLFLCLAGIILTMPATITARPVDECQNMQPGWIFCSGFEEGNFDIWDDYDGNPPETNRLLEDGGPFGLEGNHVAQLRVPPGRGGADFVKVLGGGYDRLYARWYVKWEDGYDFDAPSHGSGLHAGSRDYLGHSDYRPDGTDWFSSWIEPQTSTHRLVAYTYYRGMYMECSDPNGSCWGDFFPCMLDEGTRYCTKEQHRETVTPPALETGRWYCIEMMIDAGDPVWTDAEANGILTFWIDGVEIGPWTDLWFRTTSDLQLTILWLNLFHHGEHSVEGIMLDNVVVSTQRIGPAEFPPDLTLPDNQWRQISLPGDPGEENTVAAIFADDIPGTYGTSWIVYTYDAQTHQYRNPGLDGTISPGTGLWILQQSGGPVTIDMPDTTSDTPVISPETCPSANGCHAITVIPPATNGVQWNMLGYPFRTTGHTDDFRVETSLVTAVHDCSDTDGCTLVEAREAQVLHDVFWHYADEATGYQAIQPGEAMSPWDGFWAAALGNAGTTTILTSHD